MPLDLIILAALIFSAYMVLTGTRRAFQEVAACRKSTKFLFIVWALYFFGIGLYNFGLRDENIADGALDIWFFVQVSVTIFAAIFSFLFIVKGRYANSVVLLFLLIYAFLGIISASYSPLPQISIFRGGQYLITCLVAGFAILILSKEQKPDLLMNANYIFILAFVVLTLVGALVDPDTAFREFGGVFGKMLYGYLPYINANTFGWLCAVLVVVSSARLVSGTENSSKNFWLSVLFASFLAMILAQSRTAILTITILTPFFLARFATKKMTVLFLVIAVSAISPLIFILLPNIPDLVMEYLKRGQQDSAFETLDGRFEYIEGQGFSAFLEAPFFGHGYDAGVRLLGDHFHNSHAQILTNSGIVGYFFWISGIVSMFFYIAHRCLVDQRISTYRRYEINGILFLVAARSFTGTIMVIHDWVLMIVLAIFVYCSVLHRIARVDK